MAKKVKNRIKLVSSADTGYFYITTKNSKTITDKLEMKKYDPKARQHVLFREARLK